MNCHPRDSCHLPTPGASFVVDESLTRDVATARVRGRRLGHGTYGTIYATSSQDKDEYLVAKVIEANVASFLELTIMASLRHPNLNSSRGICSGVDSSVYILQDRAMADYTSYYQSTYCQRETQISYPDNETIVEWYWELAQAVKALHALKIVHGDIKAANVLVSNTGSVVLCDFGMASLETPTNQLDPRYQCSSSRAVGTLSHTPSEVIRGEPWSFPLDIWSLGCTFYQMYYGRLPFILDRDATEDNLAKLRAWEEVRSYVLNHEDIPDPPHGVLDLHPDFGSPSNAFVDVIIVNMLVNDPVARPDAETVVSFLSCLLGREPAGAVLLAETETRPLTDTELSTLDQLPKLSPFVKGWVSALASRLRREAKLEDFQTLTLIVSRMSNLIRDRSIDSGARLRMLSLAHEIGYHLLLHPETMARLASG